MIDSSDDAIIGTDLHGVVTSWNAGAERIFGYQAEEIVGRSVGLLALPHRRDKEQKGLDGWVVRAAPMTRTGQCDGVRGGRRRQESSRPRETVSGDAMSGPVVTARSARADSAGSICSRRHESGGGQLRSLVRFMINLGGGFSGRYGRLAINGAGMRVGRA